MWPVALNDAAQLGVDFLDAVEVLKLDAKRLHLVRIEHMALVDFDRHGVSTDPVRRCSVHSPALPQIALFGEPCLFRQMPAVPDGA